MAQFDVAVVGAGPAAFHAVEEIVKKSKTTRVAYVHGYTFKEWSMAAAIFLNDPEEHKTWVAGDPEKWKVPKAKWPNVTYFLSAPETIDCEKKEVRLMNKGPDAGTVISYKAIILATGSNSPLISPSSGMSLSERVAEVKACGKALKGAKTVIFNGAGLVGVEMCGDFRARNGYGAKVILLSRSGTILDADFGEKSKSPDPQLVDKITKTLTGKFKVEIKKASISDPSFQDAKLSPGSLSLDSGEKLDFDVYIPCYAVRPNTACLTGAAGLLDSAGALVTNDCLQSKVHPELFGVGLTTVKLVGHPAIARLTAAGEHCARQALAFAAGKDVVAFVDKAFPNMVHPMNVKMGHGPGGYTYWTGLPGPAKVCCCIPCGGGFPFCPPPCCWCCVGGCSHACGTCGSPPEGEGPAIFMLNLFTQFKTPAKHGFYGLGEYGPEQQKMT